MRRRASLERRVQLTLSPPGKRTARPVKPSPESLAAGRRRRRIEAIEEARRLRRERDYLNN